MRNLIFMLFLLVSGGLHAQVDTTTPPYLRYPSLPPLHLLLGDSASSYTREQVPARRQVLVMLFHPDCSHCQKETEEIVAHRDDFRNTQIIMATTSPIWQMNEFSRKYGLETLDFVVVGRDIYYMLPPFYMIRNLPYMALYNKKGKLITGLEGSHGIPRVLDLFRDSGK